MACCRHTPLPTQRPPRMPRRQKSTVQRYKGREENGSPRGASDCNAGHKKMRREKSPARIILPYIRLAALTRAFVLRVHFKQHRIASPHVGHHRIAATLTKTLRKPGKDIII